MKKGLWGAMIALLAATAACAPQSATVSNTGTAETSKSPALVEVAQLNADLKAGQVPILVDVRTPEEFQSGHIAGALNLPVDQLSEKLETLKPYQDRPVYVICRSGRRSAAAAQLLAERGFQPVDVAGGMLAWQQAGLPTE